MEASNKFMLLDLLWGAGTISANSQENKQEMYRDMILGAGLGPIL